MITTRDRFNLLINTKDRIRRALNAAGKSVTTSVPFSKYPDYINDIAWGKITDPKKYREVYRNPLWPQMLEASELDDTTDNLTFLIDCNNEINVFAIKFLLSQWGAGGTLTIQYYKNNILVNEEVSTEIYSNTQYNFIYYKNNDYNYVVLKYRASERGGYEDCWLQPPIVPGSSSTYARNDLLEIQANCDSITLSGIGQSCYRLTYYGCKGLNANYITTYFRDCRSLEAVTTFELYDESIYTSISGMFQNCTHLKLIPNIYFQNVTDMSYTFNGCASLETIPDAPDSFRPINMTNTFSNCNSLLSLPLINYENVTSANGLCSYCYSLKRVDNINLINAQSVSIIFDACYSLELVNNLTISNPGYATQLDMTSCFRNCVSLREIRNLNIRGQNVNCGWLFGSSSGLTTITGDFSGLSATNSNTAFSGLSLLKYFNVLGIKVGITLSSSTKFTHDDLIVILNNLENVASSQTLTLGTVNLNKLSADEKAIATQKGWNLN